MLHFLKNNTLLTDQILVSLARAVYSRASILLLDDVLSAGKFVLLQTFLEGYLLFSQSTPTLPTIYITNVSRVTFWLAGPSSLFRIMSNSAPLAQAI